MRATEAMLGQSTGQSRMPGGYRESDARRAGPFSTITISSNAINAMRSPMRTCRW